MIFFFASCLGNTHKYDIYHLSLFTLFDFSILWDALLATFLGYHFFDALWSPFRLSFDIFWLCFGSLGHPLGSHLTTGAKVDSRRKCTSRRLGSTFYSKQSSKQAMPANHQANKASKQTRKQTSKQTSKQANKQTSKQARQAIK